MGRRFLMTINRHWGYIKKTVIVMIHFIDTEGGFYNEVLHTVKRHHSRPG